MGQPSPTMGQNASGGKGQSAPQPQGPNAGKAQQSPQPQYDRYQTAMKPPGGYEYGRHMVSGPQQGSGKGQQPPEMFQTATEGSRPQYAQPQGGKGQQSPQPQGGMMMPGAGKGQQPPGMGYNNGLSTFTPQGGPQQYGNAQPLGYANMQGGPWGGWQGNPNPWGGPSWAGGQQYGNMLNGPAGYRGPGGPAPQTGGADPRPTQPPLPAWNSSMASGMDATFIRNLTNADPGRQNEILSGMLTRNQINDSMNQNPMDPYAMAEYAKNPANAALMAQMRQRGMGSQIDDYVKLYGGGRPNPGFDVYGNPLQGQQPQAQPGTTQDYWRTQATGQQAYDQFQQMNAQNPAAARAFWDASVGTGAGMNNLAEVTRNSMFGGDETAYNNWRNQLHGAGMEGRGGNFDFSTGTWTPPQGWNQQYANERLGWNVADAPWRMQGWGR